MVKYFLIVFCLLVTVKYHFRFNEERKMLDLENINLSNYFKTEKIDPKLQGLNGFRESILLINKLK